MSSWIPLVALPTLAALLALFSTLSLALRIPSRVRISEQFENAGRQDRFRQFVSDRSRYMLATAVSRSLVVLILFIGVMYYHVTADIKAFASSDPLIRVTVACLIAWTIVLVFGVAIPNAWAKYSGEWLTVRCLPLLAVLRWACFPLLLIVELFDPLVRRLAGVPHRDAQSFADELEQEILHAVSEGELHGAVDEEEKEMIESVIELTDTRVAEIMTPRTDIVALPKDADLSNVLETIRSKGHSRIPVFDGTIDTILGVLYAKDLLLREEGKPFSLTSVMRKALFVPETKSVRDLLREFQVQRVHIAIVLDEYGGTAGLVTIEDILEELVGEITDEYEPEVPVGMKRIDEHTVEVDARMRIDDLNHELDIELPEDEDYETIGGFVFSTMGRIPKPGEHCEFANVAIHVVAAEPRRVTRLRLKIKPVDENQRVAG